MTKIQNLKMYDEKITKGAAAIIRRRLKEAENKDFKASNCRVFLFGSRADGTAKERSDYDIGIDCDGALPAITWTKIQEDIEKMPTLFKIDVVDFKETTGRFREVAKGHIIEL